MKDSQAHFIDIAQLRIGLYVYLDLGWMDHPFALNSFKIGSDDQIKTIRGLGLERIRYSPELSDPESGPEGGATAAGATSVTADKGRATTTTMATATSPEPAGATTPVAAAGADVPDAGPDPAVIAAAAEAARAERRDRLAAQRASLQRCENQFAETTRSYRQVVDTAHSQPAAARAHCEAVIGGLVGQLAEQEESYVRLLSEKAGEKTSLHAINVTIISLLLGKALALDDTQMRDLGLGALLHDIGKMDLPDRLRWGEDQLSAAERQIFREHVGHGVALAQKMGLSKEVQLIIGQHHEQADGGGYPLKIRGEQLTVPSRIVCLVNQYDNLCNPGNPSLAVTPHEALSMIYAQMKRQFDPRTLALFIRMMGVYPPGSVVELSDGRYAMVVSVNSSRPLRPHVIAHDAQIRAAESLIIDLEDEPDLGIRRSIKPLQLPKAAYDALSPRKRLCYFFERGREQATPVGAS